jgi:hypothetical protein
MTLRPSTQGSRRRGQRGQALPLFAGGLVALLVGAGFVLDSGIAFVSRREAQNAADLGALSGTQAVAAFHMDGTGTSASVHAAIDATIRDNGCTPDGDESCLWTAEYVVPTTGYGTVAIDAVGTSGAIPVSAQGVTVNITRSPSTFFLRLVEQDDWNVTADATAITSRLEGVGEGVLLPLAFDPGRELAPGNRYRFSEGQDAAGNFSWLSWFDIGSAIEAEQNVCNPRNPAYSFPVYIPGGPGAMSRQGIRNCLDDLIGGIVHLPVWDDCPLGDGVTGSGANVEYCIVGVAAFNLEGYAGSPAISEMWGTLVGVSEISSTPANWAGPPCAHGTSGCNSPTSYLGLIK